MSKTKGKAKRTRRPRGSWYIERRKGSEIWYIYGTHPGTGKRIRESTGTSSEEHAAALKNKRERELLDEKIHGKAVVATFGDAMDLYLEDKKSGGSMERYFSALLDEFGDTKIKDLTTLAIREYANKAYPNRNGLSKNKASFDPIIAIVRHAAKHQLCNLPIFERFDGKSKKVDGAPDEWIVEFINRATRLKMRAFVFALASTGARCVDWRRLQWNDVIWEKGEVWFRKTKNGDDRIVPIHPNLVQMLREIEQSDSGKGPFPYSRTDVANKEIQKECERIGMAYYSSHRIGRHSFAEGLLSDGVDPKLAKDSGGWKSMHVFDSRYGHHKKGAVHDVIKSRADKLGANLRVIKGGKAA